MTRKVRESGMPPPEVWKEYFEPDQVLKKLGLTTACQDIVEFGCGYGTFTIPAARLVRGTVHQIDFLGRARGHHGVRVLR